MAMNPMQRKIRNGFLFGFLVALIIGGIVAAMLIMKNKQIQEDMVNMQKRYEWELTEVYVTTTDIEKGETVVCNVVRLPRQYVPSNAITPSNIDLYSYRDEDDVEPITGKIDEDDEDEEEEEEEEEYTDAELNFAMIAKIAIRENSILTADMVEKSLNASTFRMFEYSMISLPSMMNADDFIDIRLAISGNDCVVLSKIRVQQCTNNTIWLKLSESQMQILNCAILESYLIETSKLYATVYTDEAQYALNCTYVPDYNTINMIKANITESEEEWSEWTALDEIDAFYYVTAYESDTIADAKAQSTTLAFRTDIIESSFLPDAEKRTEAIKDGYSAEKSAIQSARDNLMGELGY